MLARIERAERMLFLEHLEQIMRPSHGEAAVLRIPLGVQLREVEKDYILASLQRNGGNKARTAEVLGISEKTLYNKLNRYAALARDRVGEGGDYDPDPDLPAAGAGKS